MLRSLILLTASLYFLSLKLQAQPISLVAVDSLLKALQVSKPDTSRVNLWLRLGEFYVPNPEQLQANMDKVYAYAEKAANLSLSLRFNRGHDQSQRLLARIFFQSNQINQVNALLQKTQPSKNKTALLLLIGQLYQERPKELPADLDSAEAFVRQAFDMSVTLNDAPGQVEGLALLGGIYLEKGNPMKARAYLRRAFPLIKQIKDRRQKARLWILLGDGFSNAKDDLPVKIHCNEQALTLYRQVGNKEQEAAALKEIADWHLQQGKLAQCVGELMEVLRIQKSIHYRELHYTYDLLGAAYQMMDNYGEALPYTLATIESAQASGDTVSIDFFRIRLGNLYAKLGDQQKALQVFKGILARQQNNKGEKYRIIYCAGQINRQLLALNRPAEALNFLRQNLKSYPPDSPLEHVEASFFLGEAYLHLKSYALAEENFLKVLKISSSKNYLHNEDRLTIFTNQNLAKLYRETGQYQKARSCIRQAFILAEQRKFIKELSETHLQAFRLDSLQGNFPAAIAHYQQYTALNDSIYNEKKSNQLLGFQVQYDTQKKEQNLKLKEQDIKLKEKNIALLTQQSKAQQARISQRQTERNTLMGGTVLLLIILVLGYNRYRLKQRSNQQLQAQQLNLQAQQQQINQKNQDLQLLLEEKEWMMKEIHHRVKNNLQLITGLLYSQAAYLQDPAALTAIRESHNRVHAMALIHQKLYQSNKLETVTMNAYIQEIVTHLLDSFNSQESIHLQLAVSALELDVSLAVPLGLIINEAVTNSLKYAFPAGQSGTIGIGLQSLDSQTYQLTIADNGIGMPAEFNLQQSRTLGLNMIQGLSRQIKGSLHLSHQPGVQINLQFTPLKLIKRHALSN